jgi:hypothetical protein
LTPVGGYSGRPLPQKLGVKPGGRLLLLGAPRGWSAGPLRDLALPLGLVDVKVAALGEAWSGLRLVWRRERRGG